MFTSIYAAETQYRLDSAQRDRALAHLVAMRERAAAPPVHRAAARLLSAREQLQIARQRAAWPRPISPVHVAQPVGC